MEDGNDAEKKNPLEDVQVGDILIVRNGSSRKIVQVKRTTKAWIFLGNSKYRKSDGMEIGVTHSIWHVTPYIRVPREGELEEIREKIKHNRLVKTVSDIDWGSKSTEMLEKIINLASEEPLEDK